MKLLINKHVVRVGFSVVCNSQVADTGDNTHFLFQGTAERGDQGASRCNGRYTFWDLLLQQHCSGASV